MTMTEEAVRPAAPVPTTSPRRLLAGTPDFLFPSLGPATSAALFHGLEGAPAPPTDPAIWARESPVIMAVRLSGLALATLDTAGVRVDPLTRARLESARDADSALS